MMERLVYTLVGVLLGLAGAVVLFVLWYANFWLQNNPPPALWG